MSRKDKAIARYYNRAAYYEITEKDVDKTTFWFHGPQSFTNVLGRVFPQDVGKRIYHTKNNTLQVENEEQFQKRLSKNFEEQMKVSKSRFSKVCKSVLLK